MSLHVPLSPEAIAHLEKQKRLSSLSAMLLSFLSVVMIGLVLTLFLLPAVVDETQDFIIHQPPKYVEPPIEAPVFNPSLERNPSPPTSSHVKVIAAPTLSQISIPVPDVDVAAPTLEFGSGDDFGVGFTQGPGTKWSSNLPIQLTKRCDPADRAARLRETGGTDECESAVVKALDWFQSKQKPDGSWPGGNTPAAMTGLALLAYLGHCETPLSPKYGQTVVNAMTYLVNLGMKNDGKLSANPNSKHWPYEHAIATYALAEATTFCRQVRYEMPNLEEVTRTAGQFIIDNQHNSGGWDYSYDRTGNRGGDLSIAAWHIQALKACEHTGLEFEGMRKCLKNAADYVKSLANENGGFGYTSPQSHNPEYATLTGAGVLCLQLLDMENTRAASRGIKYIRENSKFEYDTRFSDLYGHYYEAQAMMKEGGRAWDWYNDMFRDQLVKAQLPDGSWPAPGAKDGGKIRAVAPQYTSNEVYRVALNTLMLEVYYRFLPGTGKQ